MDREEKKLIIPESLASNILDSFPVGVDVVDENLKVKYMNKFFLDSFGKDALGKTCYEIYRDDKQQCENCPLKTPLSVGKTSTIETEGVTGGRIFKISHTCIILEGKKMIAEIFFDITKEKEYINELEEFNRISINRELQMIKLKEEIKKLKGL